MKRRLKVALLCPLGVVAAIFFPRDEYTFEFDTANLRVRECSRTRSWLFGFVMRERCGPAADLPVAVRLRELGVLPPVNEAEARWVLNKGFTAGVRGWKGVGWTYVIALGPALGAPVTLPVAGDPSGSVWVRWAERDPAAATRFWGWVREVGAGGPGGDRQAAEYLLAAGQLLARRRCEVTGAEVEAHARRVVDE